MNITNETLLEWLKQERRSQQWLAMELGVTNQAVSNWLKKKNPRPISSRAKIKIAELIARHEEMTESAPMQNLVLKFSQTDFDNICRAANSHDQLPREWAQEKLCELAHMDIEQVAATIRAAEDQRPYGNQKKTM